MSEKCSANAPEEIYKALAGGLKRPKGEVESPAPGTPRWAFSWGVKLKNATGRPHSVGLEFIELIESIAAKNWSSNKARGSGMKKLFILALNSDEFFTIEPFFDAVETNVARRYLTSYIRHVQGDDRPFKPSSLATHSRRELAKFYELVKADYARFPRLVKIADLLLERKMADAMWLMAIKNSEPAESIMLEWIDQIISAGKAHRLPGYTMLVKMKEMEEDVKFDPSLPYN